VELRYFPTGPYSYCFSSSGGVVEPPENTTVGGENDQEVLLGVLYPPEEGLVRFNACVREQEGWEYSVKGFVKRIQGGYIVDTKFEA